MAPKRQDQAIQLLSEPINQQKEPTHAKDEYIQSSEFIADPRIHKNHFSGVVNIAVNVLHFAAQQHDGVQHEIASEVSEIELHMTKVPPPSAPHLDIASLDISRLSSAVSSWHRDSSASTATENAGKQSIENENENDE